MSFSVNVCVAFLHAHDYQLYNYHDNWIDTLCVLFISIYSQLQKSHQKLYSYLEEKYGLTLIPTGSLQ